MCKIMCMGSAVIHQGLAPVLSISITKCALENQVKWFTSKSPRVQEGEISHQRYYPDPRFHTQNVGVEVAVPLFQKAFNQRHTLSCLHQGHLDHRNESECLLAVLMQHTNKLSFDTQTCNSITSSPLCL